MGSLFKAGSSESTNSTESTTNASGTTDPWAGMPTEVVDAYLNDLKFQQTFMDQATQLAENSAANPAQVLGVSDAEWQAARDSAAAATNANAVTQQGLNVLNSAGDYSGVGSIADQDLSALQKSYANAYTDDVVSTTLAGMDRSAAREALKRQEANAAIGGTSNTRQAVADAVAEQLNGMNKAEMEAKLRSDAFTTGNEAGLAAANYGLDEDTAQTSQQLALAQAKDSSSQSIAELLDQLAGSQYGRSTTAAATTGDLATQQRALSQQQLDNNYSSGQDAYSWLANMFAGVQNKSTVPVGGTTTEDSTTTGSTTTTTPTASTFGKLLGTAANAAAIYASSDERLKTDIEPLSGEAALAALRETRPSEYRYTEDAEGHPGYRTDRHAGIMAQSATKIPGAVVQHEDGTLMLSAFPILATVVAAVTQLDKEMHGGKARAAKGLNG